MGKQRNVWVGVLVLVLSMSVGAVLFGKDQSKETETLKVGVIASLTGKGADRGEGVLRALELAREKIERDGILKQKIEFIVQDVPLDGVARGPIAYQALVNAGVDVVIGPMGSGVAAAVAPLADGAQVPTIMHTASAKGVTENNEYVFRLWATADGYASVIADEIERLGYTRIAVLTSSNENTVDLFNALEREAPNHGFEIVMNEQVSIDVYDVRTQLLKMKDQKPDAVMLNVFEGQFVSAISQAQTLRLGVPLFANAVLAEAEVTQAPEGSAEGIWFPRFVGWDEETARAYAERFGTLPSGSDSAAGAYAALMIIATAVQGVGTEPEEIKEYLYTHSFSGSLGVVSFLPSGEPELEIVIKEVQGGGVVNRSI